MEKTYEVKGMTCVMCKNNVEKTVAHLDGVNIGRVNLLENELTIDFDETRISETAIAEAIAKAGYEMVLNKENKIDMEKVRLFSSIILNVILMYFSMGHMFGLPQVEHRLSVCIQGLLALVVLFINRHYFKGALASIRNRILNMDVLVSLSTAASFFYSLFAVINIFKGNMNYHVYFETAAMIITFVSIGKFIEGNTKAKTSKVIRGLATLIPMQTNIIVDGQIKTIPIAELKKNDVCLIRAGESIPQDGVVISGYSQVDESMITGESLPVNKQENDEVIGGTINQNGTLEIRITKRANQTVLSNIISLTKEATMKKIPIERFADTVSKYFVIAVISISLLTFIIWILISKDFEKALNFAICVLVVSCPCALGLATPSAIAVASGVGARNGILIKDPKILEIAGRLKTVIFDKTGTLTLNKLSVNDVYENDEEFYAAAVSLEKNSAHPIANAIIETFASRVDVKEIAFTKTEEISGEGIVGYLENGLLLAGNRRLMERYNIAIPEAELNKAKEKGYSMVMVASDTTLLGIIYLSDTIREESLGAIKGLKKRDIEPVMCTGDNQIAAERMANYTGISTYLYEVKPKEKEELVQKRKADGPVAMVGDGINDAIALSSADVSFTIASGSDIASASSDVILMKNDLSDIAFTYDLSKMTMRIIRQNLFWALFYNSIFIPVAAGCLSKYGIVLTPMFGALAMSISSIFVLSNALRINTIKKKEN